MDLSRDFSKEDRMLLAGAEDKYKQCRDQYRTTYTNFLDLRQRSLVARLFAEVSKKDGDVRCVFYGGYDDAERVMAVFLPDYADETECPLSVIRISTSSGSRKLTHRDYLGSLTGLGLKREVIGDILVNENGADVIILDDVKEFLLMNYSKAGRTSLELSTVPLDELYVPEGNSVTVKDTVASLRLDNVISSAFGMSRAKAAEAIKRGIVFVNSMECPKVDMQVKEGDKLVLRGKGKAYLSHVGGRTRKDRVFVEIERFV
jgi:RNA-binding protein YlmH